jgi:hypothetical protein
MHRSRLIILALAGLSMAISACHVSPARPAEATPPVDFRTQAWEIDARPVLARGGEGSLDRGVVGDPCIVWDDAVGTWRMFYFASGIHPETGARGPRTAMALAASAEAIGPGEWRKLGLVPFSNPEALINANDYHKWWVVTDALRPNRAARIDGRYWSIFTASKPMAGGRLHKHIQAAFADTLAGPWTLLAEPIIAPGDGDALDALHADTPSAFWFEDRNRVAIYYKGYPTEAQASQPKAPFGSGTMLATWHPREPHARKVKILMRAGQTDAWNQGWMSSIQLFQAPGTRQWYGLHNASPTPPVDRSHREPAPSLGGWVVCNGDPLEGAWQTDTRFPPFRHPEQLTPDELAAGIGVNFWRHHLLVTPQGQTRIFFNSGTYGREQMYSLVPRK